MPKYEMLDISCIKLDYDNPRIALMLERLGGKENVTAAAVALALGSNGDGAFDVLKSSIKTNGGIIQPIIVNRVNGEYIVVEGNTRVQIYKELLEEDRGKENEDNWKCILAVVHDNLTTEQIDAIRLQAHLVGPRDWDPYSKAKYLYTLSVAEYLSINEIVAFCGGKKSEVNKMISAYKDMQSYLVPKLEGADIPHKKFSAFMELQNKSILNAIVYNHFTKEDFADWVLNDNIDKMANVRMLPHILPDKQAREVFLRENCTEAYKYISVPELASGLLKDATIETLSRNLEQKLQHIEHAELKRISSGADTAALNTKIALEELLEVLKETISDIENM